MYRLVHTGELPPDGRHGGRGELWWRADTVAAYRACRPPQDALWTSDVAKLLGVSRESVRRRARTTLPPDGVHRGRRWWLASSVTQDPVDEAAPAPP